MRKRDRPSEKSRRGEYKALRNDLVARVRRAERDNLSSRIKESWNDTKKQWKILKQVTNKMNDKCDITSKFLHNGIWIEDHNTTTKNMIAYLSQVGPTTNNSVGQSKESPEYYLQRYSKANTETILLGDVTEQEVIDVCSKLTPKTSTDTNSFVQNIVLSDVDIMTPLIVHFVNCSQRGH
jgi:hypothetical protein